MFNDSWKVYNLAYHTPKWYVSLLLNFRSFKSHYDPAVNRGVVYKTLVRTIYVYYTFSYAGEDPGKAPNNPPLDEINYWEN